MTREMEEEAEVTRRRATRVLWTFRLTFYPAVVAIAAILLVGRGDATVTGALHGTTSQTHGITIQLDDDGRPVGLSAELTMWCPNGASPRYRWRTTEGGGARFHREGSRLWVVDPVTDTFDDGTVSRLVRTLEAHVEPGRVEGVLEVVEHVDEPGDRPIHSCASRAVAFSAQR